ncbi:MAG: hypothetical protein NTX00_03345, partial [Candidatus Parcubacteria bacterium]|nr:hypothetical protein [Candidatus Parcubacteria bacterium]
MLWIFNFLAFIIPQNPLSNKILCEANPLIYSRLLLLSRLISRLSLEIIPCQTKIKAKNAAPTATKERLANRSFNNMILPIFCWNFYNPSSLNS